MNIICRHANNDLHALWTAQGMENAGASVISISHNGMRHPDGALIPSSSFIVWGRYEAPVTPDKIDEAIELAFDGR